MTTAHYAASAAPISARTNVEDEDAARLHAVAATNAEPAVREAARFLFDGPPPGEALEVEEEGPGFYRAPAVAAALAGALVAYREQAALTQRDVARRLLLHQSAVARLETGKHTPDLETLVRLARRLRLDLTVRVTPRGATLEVRDAEPNQ